MEQSIIDKIELIEKENRLIKRAIKAGICPVCGEKVEQRDVQLGFGMHRISIVCTVDQNHYDSGEFADYSGTLDEDEYCGV